MKKTSETAQERHHSGAFAQVLVSFLCSFLRIKSTETTRGFTLLLAVLVSSVLIALGSAIYDIVSKEIVLSSAGRESQFSFYAADTGIECVLYHDFQNDLFSTSSTATTASCGGGPDATLTRTLTDQGTPQEVLVTSFVFPIGGVAEALPCAQITVTREHAPTRTTIESRGYNTCLTTSSQRLERAIRVTY